MRGLRIGWTFELNHVSLWIRGIDGRAFALRAVPLLDSAGFVAIPRELVPYDCFVERLDPQAEVVHVSALLAGCGSAGTPELPVDRHQVNEGTAGAELNETDLFLAPLNSATEGVAVEPHHLLQIDDAENQVIDA
jgi:hypothetical protein